MERNDFPEDTDTEIWIQSNSLSLQELFEHAKEKWPQAELGDIQIDAIHHHQYCVTYDLHDPSDYVDYTVLTYTKE